MDKHDFSGVKKDIAMAPVAAGTTDTQVGLTIDTLGYETITFVVYLGAITSTGTATIKLQADTASGMGTVADVANSSVVVDDTGGGKGYESITIHRPTKRYVRVAVTRATANVVINGAFVILGRAGVQPAAQGTTMGNVNPGVLVSVP